MAVRAVRGADHQAILSAARTGEVGDGKIFVHRGSCIRIRQVSATPLPSLP